MGRERKVRVLLVDDHPLIREGLRAVLAFAPGFEVVGEAADGEAAVASYERLRPDAAIVDLRLPKLGGPEAIAAIRRIDPGARIVALTSFTGDADIASALAAGASGCLLKGSSGDEVVAALQRAVRGQQTISPEAAQELRGAAEAPALSPRETEILGLVGQGLRNRQIAERLGLTVGTVKLHVARILEKLDAQDRTEAVTCGIRRGLIRLE